MLIFSLAIILLAISIQPQSLSDLQLSLVELKNEDGTIVFSRQARLNVLVLPTNVENGEYSIYVDGRYMDDITYAGNIQEEPTLVLDDEEITEEKRVNIKNIDGAYTLKWERETNERSSSIQFDGLDAFMEDYQYYMKYQRVLLQEINTSLLAGVVLLSVFLLAFNTGAYITTLQRPDSSFRDYFLNGWEVYPYTVKSAFIWTVLLSLVAVPTIIVVSVLNVPNNNLLIIGIISFSVIFTLHQVGRSTTGYYLLEGFLLSAVSAFVVVIFQSILALILVAFFVALVLVPMITMSNISDNVPLEKSEAWKEDLL